MATIRIYRDERDGEDFPPRCVRCGAEAETTSTQRFSWVPPWVIVFIFFGLLPWLIITLVTRKSMRVALPICMKHRNHWLNRKRFVWLGLVFWIVYGIALAVEWDDLPKDASSVALGILIFGGLIWLISAAIYGNSAIKPSKITQRYMDLVGVDKEFAREWEEDLPDSEPVPRPKKRRKQYDDEDDD